MSGWNERLCQTCEQPFYTGGQSALRTCPECRGHLTPRKERDVTDHMERPMGERLAELPEWEGRR